ncbi:uncharacterized protein CG5098 [Cotesia glomerata]|uniref:PHD-type domain-containing protein n=1 Tax=Cotesia glomerata TaxID=32391 RepID=A0AAV7I2M0_COTGL|nr:uncharacterized protein CG5098 [Cotesia glomerata]XP_044576648.1 uncharacterized protein CG5098 [Cotesia glomerata]KAH0541117.1 hypothetical protein KQX54_021087 [Cotesia glomerata]
MRGKETMNTSLGWAREYGPTTRIKVPDTEIDIGKIDCQLSSINNNYQKIPNLNLTNLDPHLVSQNGLNYWNHNIAPYDGLPLLEYAPQWALPSTHSQWDHQENPLLAYNSAYVPWSLNKNTINIPKELNTWYCKDSHPAIELAKPIVELTPPKNTVLDQPVDLSVRSVKNNLCLKDCKTKLSQKDLKDNSVSKCEAKELLSPIKNYHSKEEINFVLPSSKIKTQKCDLYSPKFCSKESSGIFWPTKKLDVDACDLKAEQVENQGKSLNLLSQNIWEDFAMSGQYPGHSRPPVGTPPPQAVWNHLTMTQGSGLNLHPTALSGATLNPAGFYTHPSMARTSHLSSQLTPQLAHTQAPPTWHTPTVPSKNVTSNAPGNPLFSLQMLVDNRQNQNQYRSSPGSQSTLDLSATSEMAENYSRMTQEIPISLTARSVDKGSRNGNIISPPIPLNGETSSDSGISSSVPTPNSLGDPLTLSLSTKDQLLTTPKITVKNFESNLKGVANLHDKMKELTGGVDNFTQKMINLPPSVTIERVLPDKKDTEPVKVKDSLSVIAQGPRSVLPVIVNLTSRLDKDVTDSPKREPSSERDRKIDEMNVRSPKNLPKRGKKGVDSLLEKLEGGNKKLGNTENIGSVIVTPVEEVKDTCSVKSMSPERQKSKSPTREEDVVSPEFSNDDSNDNMKQRRKRKLEKPVRLSKDSKMEVEDMELEPTEPREPRICETVREELEEATSPPAPVIPPQKEEVRLEKRLEQAKTNEEIINPVTKANQDNKVEENEPVRRRSSSEGSSSTTNPAPTNNQRVRRKSSDDVSEFSKITSPKGVNNAIQFNEVESELEKMFAGIVETDTDVKKEQKVDGSTTAAATTTTTTTTTTSTTTTTTIDANAELDPLKQETGDDIKAESIDTLNSTNPTDVTSTVGTKPPAKKGKKGRARAKKRKASRAPPENMFGPHVGENIGLRDAKRRKQSKGLKKKFEVGKKKKPDGLREIAYDSGSNASSIRSRGPVVHVEGPRDSPLSVQVVNAPREEEEEKSKEKRKSVGNGNVGRSKRLSHQNDLDYRGKVSKAGLFSSTLSSRYDAHTTDSTWVCVFCKQGPHYVVPGDPSRPHPNLAGPHIAPGTYTVPAGVLSDLFGPYLIGKERLEESILSADEQEITTEQKKGGKNKRSLRYAGLADMFSAKMGKKKRNSVEATTPVVFTGMTVIPGDEQRWEVWLHEQCAVWAAGVYLAGGRVTGLQEAVWDATKSICNACGMTGANIGCVKRGCKDVTHYPCALSKGWHLDNMQYIPKCSLHRVT